MVLSSSRPSPILQFRFEATIDADGGLRLAAAVQVEVAGEELRRQLINDGTLQQCQCRVSHSLRPYARAETERGAADGPARVARAASAADGAVVAALAILSGLAAREDRAGRCRRTFRAARAASAADGAVVVTAIADSFFAISVRGYYWDGARAVGRDDDRR